MFYGAWRSSASDTLGRPYVCIYAEREIAALAFVYEDSRGMTRAVVRIAGVRRRRSPWERVTSFAHAYTNETDVTEVATVPVKNAYSGAITCS